jgi:hypothetical protein
MQKTASYRTDLELLPGQQPPSLWSMASIRSISERTAASTAITTSSAMSNNINASGSTTNYYWHSYKESDRKTTVVTKFEPRHRTSQLLSALPVPLRVVVRAPCSPQSGPRVWSELLDNGAQGRKRPDARCPRTGDDVAALLGALMASSAERRE